MNALDYAVLVFLFVCLGAGFIRGAIRELVYILGWVVGFILAQSFAMEGAGLLAEWMSEPLGRYVLAWLLIFLFVLMLFSLIGSLIAGAVRKLGLGGVDRLGGVAIGAAKGALVLVLLAMMAGLTTIPNTNLWKQSTLSPWLERAAMQAKQLLPADLAARITFGKSRT